MSSQTFKNDPVDRHGEGHYELEKALRSIWLDRRFLLQTFNRFEDINVEEIRKLLDEDVSSIYPNATPPPVIEVVLCRVNHLILTFRR